MTINRIKLEFLAAKYFRSRFGLQISNSQKIVGISNFFVVYIDFISGASWIERAHLRYTGFDFSDVAVISNIVNFLQKIEKYWAFLENSHILINFENIRIW